MRLLVDIGNTRLKWCHYHAGQWSLVKALNIQDADFWEHLQQWRLLKEPPRVLAITSVNKPAMTDDLIEFATTLWPSLTVFIARSEKQACGVTNAYRQPEKLGVDRWLALIAVRHMFKDSCCVIDCGSAVTLDWINAQGEHQGGLIAPGIRLMQQALHQNTEQLPAVCDDYGWGKAQETSAAIYSGVLGAVVGLIEKSLREYPASHIVLTGGDAINVGRELTLDFISEPNLVFKGLIQRLDA